jgi:hypothetical protein
MSVMQKLNSLLGFPKVKAVKLSNGKWLALVRLSPFEKWQGAGKHGTWNKPEHIEEYCLYLDEEQAMEQTVKIAFPKKVPTIVDEITKALK